MSMKNQFMSTTTRLEEVLEDYTDEKITLVEPGGNHGDRLIYLGFEKKATELGIEYDSVNYLESLRNNLSTKIRKGVNIIGEQFGTSPLKILDFDDSDAIYIHGGGNFSDLWGGSMEIFRNVTQNHPDIPIIVGPQTYWFSETDFLDLVEGTTQEIHLFCREKYSYNLLTGHELPDNVSVHCSPDTAFYLNRDDLLKFVDGEDRLDGSHSLVAFRDDKESIVAKSEQEKIALSSPNPVTKDISDKSLTTFGEFVAYTENAETAYTDRLHVSILGTLLGTDVELYENVYYKNRGVYKYSMESIESTKFNEAV